MTRSHMMRSHGLFLLLYLIGLCWGTSVGLRNGSCPTGGTCAQMGSAESFLQCVGLPSTDSGPQHLHRLFSISEALMDLYTFMRASVSGVPVLGLAGGVDLSLTGEPLQNEALVHVWLEVKMKPLLKSVSKQLLSCLSSKNFSCNTYQLIVRELSEHFSDMDPVRQKWIYDFFMYPFLSRDGVRGCVEPGQNSVDWLLKNFGDFRAVARVKDFSALYMDFSGLEVLELLTPAQLAEIMLTPEVAGLDNGTLHLVFHHMVEPEHNWTIPEYNYSTAPPGDPNSLSIYQPENTVWNGVMGAFKPISAFVHDFVTLTKERDVAEIRSTDLAQLVLNFTLSELANMYAPQPPPDRPPEFDPTSVEDWYKHVVLPVLCRFLPEEFISQSNISMAFHQLFYLEHGMNESASELQDVCSLTLDQAQCGLTDVVEDLARVMHCAAQTPLTLDQGTVLGLLFGLSHRLGSLLGELATTDMHALAAHFKQIFNGSTSAAVTQEHLTDPDFIQTWFRIKLLPLLPDVSPELLSCLSQKNFSCQVYQTIVWDLSENMEEASVEYQERIYDHFIYPFLLHHNTSDAQCVSDNSVVWLQENFGLFAQFATITDLYRLHPDFSAMEALHLLSPLQIAELLLLASSPQHHLVVEEVFASLLSSSDGRFEEVMVKLVQLASQRDVPCWLYTTIFMELYGAIPTVNPALEPVVWASVEDLIVIAPQECVPGNVTCPITQFNGTYICSHMSGPPTWSFSNVSMDSLCAFPLEKYACAQLENFTANHLASLLSCDLPGNSSRSKVLWKLLLTKLSAIVDPALDILAAQPLQSVGPSAPELLDVLGEIRVSMLTDQELRNSSLLHIWFSRRLAAFLPHSSRLFLRCLSGRNISCSSYQHILQVFSQGFANMTVQQQNVTLHNYIIPFLSHNNSGPGCVSMNSSQWLSQNLGPFSQLLDLQKLLQLNPHINLVDVLSQLTPQQSAQMLTLPLDMDKDLIIIVLFDLYTGQKRDELAEFLSFLPLHITDGNLSCSNFRTLFNKLDLATVNVLPETESHIIAIKMNLSHYVPHDCVIYTGECTVTVTNETQICAGVNSASLQRPMNRSFCDFSVEQLACASLSNLTAPDLAEILTCSRPVNSIGSRASWKLLLSKVPHAVDPALDLLANTTLDPTQAALPLILDAIREIRLDNFPQDQINHPLVLQEWLRKLRPFLSAVSTDFLRCLTTRNLNCSTYQLIVHALSSQQPNMTQSTQMSIVTHFITVFLPRNNTADPSCSALSNGSLAWIDSNLGAFSGMISFSELLRLYPDLSLDAVPSLTLRQKAELCATPGYLQTADQVLFVLSHVPNEDLTPFFMIFSPSVMGHENQLEGTVLSTMFLEVVTRANLSDPSSISESELQLWLGDNGLLLPMLYNLSHEHVGYFFAIIDKRNCSTYFQGMKDLDFFFHSLSPETKASITEHNTMVLKDSLLCYGTNFSLSFFIFLKSSFLNFPLPNMSAILSVIPQNQRSQTVNSMPVSHAHELIWSVGVVNNSIPCLFFEYYDNTPALLKSGLPERTKASTLKCVMPLVFNATSFPDVNTWFESLFPDYMAYMTKDMMSPSATHNASCGAFIGLVRVMGLVSFSGKDFTGEDVFTTIKAYLFSESNPRCYNPSDPELNSTAWLYRFFGSFFPYATPDDLRSVCSEEFLQVFSVDPQNVALLNQSGVSQSLIEYYVGLVYKEDGNFNPLLLPFLGRCLAPGPSFTQLNPNETKAILRNLSTTCDEVSSQTGAALCGTFGDDVTSDDIRALNQLCVWISSRQIKRIPADDLLRSMDTLRSVRGWSVWQTRAIVKTMRSDGGMKVSSASTLQTMGSLVTGLPSSAFSGIPSPELLRATEDPATYQNLLSAPRVAQEACVWQMISVYNSSEAIVENVPDDMVSHVPRPRIASMSSDISVLQEMNKKSWDPPQAELFFSVVAQESSTVALSGAEGLSSSVLQGFTCTGVRNFDKSHIQKLVKACRRTGKNKVHLTESQLTCMNSHMKDVSGLDYREYPADMLLYYDYSKVPASSCRIYFEQLGYADFFIFSENLSYIRVQLFYYARICLGITTTSLTQDHVSVMGNMCCTLDASYIKNSDPSILEKLKNCPKLTVDQASAVETLLTSGNTPYGDVSTWNLETLKNLALLAVKLRPSFLCNFDKETLKDFLKYCLKENVCEKKCKDLKKMIRECNKSRSKVKRATGCTVGEITLVTISEETFPFDYYDVVQFNNCLSPATVRDNLGAIMEKVFDEEFVRVVLDKLREVYPDQDIPEDLVSAMGFVSQVATSEDISRWTITVVDTLASLFKPEDGPWDITLGREIVYKYLAILGNSLGTAELNAIDGRILCSLDIVTLQSISAQSLTECKVLVITTCSSDKKKLLFDKALSVVVTPSRSAVSATTYQLMKPYMGGASESYVKSLSESNINMDMETFLSLNDSIIQALSVSEVVGLLGANVDDLKAYENNTVISTWISQQSQSDLDALGLNLSGGRTTPTSAPGVTNPTGATANTGATTAAPGASTAAPGASTAAPGASTTTKPSSAMSLSAPSGLSLLLLLLFSNYLHIFI